MPARRGFYGSAMQSAMVAAASFVAGPDTDRQRLALDLDRYLHGPATDLAILDVLREARRCIDRELDGFAAIRALDGDQVRHARGSFPARAGTTRARR